MAKQMVAKKPKTMRERCGGKPSVALKAMCDGLLKASRRSTFVIDMCTFGFEAEGICFGCAATCAVAEVGHIHFSSHTIQERHLAPGLNADREDLIDFEWAVDDARMGDVASLFDYMKKRRRLIVPDDDWYLDTHDWRKQLPLIRKYIKKLEAAGL